MQLLKIYCNSEAKRVVYDPFMGTVTTAAACIRYDAGENKIEYFGSEISKEQCDYADERIKDARRRYSHRQLKLFEDDDDNIWKDE